MRASYICNYQLQKLYCPVRSRSGAEGEESAPGESGLYICRTFQKEPVVEMEKQQSGESQGLGEGEATEPGVWRASQGDGAVNGVTGPESPQVEWP